MSLKSRLAMAASVTLVAMSAMATTSANAFSLFDPPCVRTSMKWACGDIVIVPKYERARPTHLNSVDTSRNTDPSYDQAMQAGGGGGGGVAVAVAAGKPR